MRNLSAVSRAKLNFLSALSTHYSLVDTAADFEYHYSILALYSNPERYCVNRLLPLASSQWDE